MELRPININENKRNKLYANTDCQQVLAAYEDFYPKIGFHSPWIGYFVINGVEVVGCCGFTGRPKDGKVEIAYQTFKQFEGKGIASFSCKELISISKKTDHAVIVTAKTSPERNASTRILEKNGFVFSKVVRDEEIGDAWLWILGPEKTAGIEPGT